MKRFVLVALFGLTLWPAALRAQEPLMAARELYAAAAYEDALALLGRAPSDTASVAEADADILRAFCLLALRRDDEARMVIQDVVTERPTYVPSEEEASPRIVTAFREVRQKLLPGVVRQLYESARDSFERKEHLAAAAKFGDLLKLLEAPDLAADNSMADLRLLAEGFRAVSEAAADAIATEASVSPAGGAGSLNRGSTAATGTTGAPAPVPAVAQPTAQPVTPPEIVNQQLPVWRGDPLNAHLEHTGAIDLVIDEQGMVETVSLRDSVHPLYDAELMKVAKSWTYKPARRGDRAIKFQKTVVVRLNSR